MSKNCSTALFKQTFTFKPNVFELYIRRNYGKLVLMLDFGFVELFNDPLFKVEGEVIEVHIQI